MIHQLYILYKKLLWIVDEKGLVDVSKIKNFDWESTDYENRCIFEVLIAIRRAMDDKNVHEESDKIPEGEIY